MHGFFEIHVPVIQIRGNADMLEAFFQKYIGRSCQFLEKTNQQLLTLVARQPVPDAGFIVAAQ
jgi:hypothetical protein